MRFLVVDDSKTMRMIIIRTLRQAGFGDDSVDQAGNTAEALEAIQAAPPDLVLCDWNMPGGSGLDLLKHLRVSGSTVRFGFVTSEGSAEMRRMALEAGAGFFITKPFTPEAFQDALRAVS